MVANKRQERGLKRTCVKELNACESCKGYSAAVKKIAPEYVKVKSEEYTDCAKFKVKLLIVDDGVVFEDTSEFIPDMRNRIVPDKFTVTLS